MNGKRWRKAAVATALSLQLASPAGAFLLFGGEPASITPVIEYYNEELGEYFVTASYDEIVALDAGAAPAWMRTRDFAFYTVDSGASAQVMPGGRGTASPVCRYFIPPASHFLSASAEECKVIGERIPSAVLETEAAFYAWLADDAGECPRLVTQVDGFSFAAVYRLWDSRQGSAHRLTTSKAERDAMVAGGWISEGSGVDGVAMCVPSWSGG